MKIIRGGRRSGKTTSADEIIGGALAATEGSNK